MHIEPGVVNGAKLILSYGTASAAALYTVKLAWDVLRKNATGVLSLPMRCIATTLLVFVFFEVFPKYPVGVSEVHFILGATLFLIFGAVPAAVGLALGLLVQGLLFAPADLPQYFVNVTTLLVPLFAVRVLAKRIIAPDTPYVDLKYRQMLALSAAYQGGVISWVAFWAFYGQGFGAENLAAISSFALAYSVVIVIEPIADLAILAGAKAMRRLDKTGLTTPRLYNPA